jgi:hypothetical protein
VVVRVRFGEGGPPSEEPEAVGHVDVLVSYTRGSVSIEYEWASGGGETRSVLVVAFLDKARLGISYVGSVAVNAVG